MPSYIQTMVAQRKQPHLGPDDTDGCGKDIIEGGTSKKPW